MTRHMMPPTAVEIIIAENIGGERLAAYFQMNFEQFGALVHPPRFVLHVEPGGECLHRCRVHELADADALHHADS